MDDALKSESVKKRTTGSKRGSEGEDDRSGGVLSPRQESAVRELARGKGMVQAARAVGVSRATLYRWMGEPLFVASMNRWRARTVEMARGQLCAALRDAVDTVAKAIRDGDTKAALMVLKQMGALSAPLSECEDPSIIAREQELNERSRQVELDRAEFHLSEAEQMTAMSKAASARPPERDPSAPRPIMPPETVVEPPVEIAQHVEDKEVIDPLRGRTDGYLKPEPGTVSPHYVPPSAYELELMREIERGIPPRDETSEKP
jgi:hypothetical protein